MKLISLNIRVKTLNLASQSSNFGFWSWEILTFWKSSSISRHNSEYLQSSINISVICLFFNDKTPNLQSSWKYTWSSMNDKWMICIAVCVCENETRDVSMLCRSGWPTSVSIWKIVIMTASVIMSHNFNKKCSTRVITVSHKRINFFPNFKRSSTVC